MLAWRIIYCTYDIVPFTWRSTVYNIIYLNYEINITRTYDDIESRERTSFQPPPPPPPSSLALETRVRTHHLETSRWKSFGVQNILTFLISNKTLPQKEKKKKSSVVSVRYCDEAVRLQFNMFNHFSSNEKTLNLAQRYISDIGPPMYIIWCIKRSISLDL